METPCLETTRLILRPITKEDVDFIFKLFSRSETNQYSQYPDLVSVEEAAEMNEHYMKPGSLTHFRVAMELKTTCEPIGTLGLYLYSNAHKRAELGYDLLREYWGKGYMTEAVREVLKYGFTELGLMRVEATVDPENDLSKRLLERVGFKLEGCLRKRFYYRGKWHGELFYGLLKEEWLHAPNARVN
jgi:ribosomal-protein-alanine N-acetyltransferase